MSTYYLDSSVALRALLNHSPSATAWLESESSHEANIFISSRLLRTEITRVLRRESLPVSLRNEILDSILTIPLTDGIIAEAEAIVPHVKTLDAIHLASAIATGQDPVIVTHDTGMKSAAELLGLQWHDPVQE
ncbi:MAG: type II toxin-antitoxin system VapC family toxin [Cellulomonadaceae bacterium]|nr:type II toxin-antitoxin system VapC family toxin [Cellulomonadaceae bacterium]